MGFSPKSWLQRGRGKGPKRPEPAFRIHLSVGTVESTPAVLSELPRGVVAFRTSTPPRVGTHQELGIRIGDAKEVAVRGLVVWSKPSRAGVNAGFGAQLEDASPAFLAALVELAEQVRTRAAPAPAPREAVLAAPVTEVLRELPPPSSIHFPEPETAPVATIPPIREQPVEAGPPTPDLYYSCPPTPPEETPVSPQRVLAAAQDDLESLPPPAENGEPTNRQRALRTPEDEPPAAPVVEVAPSVRADVELPFESSGESTGKFRIRPEERGIASGADEVTARIRVDEDSFTSDEEIEKAAWALAKFDPDVIEISDDEALLAAPPVRERDLVEEAEAVLASDDGEIEIESMLATVEREDDDEIVVEYGPSGVISVHVEEVAEIEAEENLELDISPDLLLPEPDVRALGSRLLNRQAPLFDEIDEDITGMPARRVSYGFDPDEAPFPIDDSPFDYEPELPESVTIFAAEAHAAAASEDRPTELSPTAAVAETEPLEPARPDTTWDDEPDDQALAISVEGLDATATEAESTLHFQSEHDLALNADLGMLLGELPGAVVNPSSAAQRPIALIQPAGGPTVARLRFDTPRLFLAYYERYLRAGVIYVPTRVPPRPGTPVDVSIKIPGVHATLRGKAMAVIRPAGAPLKGCMLRLVDDGRLARKLQRFATELS